MDTKSDSLSSMLNTAFSTENLKHINCSPEPTTDFLALSLLSHQTQNHPNSTSEIENSILRSKVPIELKETEEITVLGQRGLWANKSESTNWKGHVPITEYPINQDEKPEIIHKKFSQQIEYIQELAVRYLQPPTPQPPGDIVITQEKDTLASPAPPLIIRQQPARPDTPEPLVLREAPPTPPSVIGVKKITISGKNLPPPPRKVIIERLAPLPSKPQSVIIERWLPYKPTKRRVVFHKPHAQEPVIIKPKNVIIQWEAPKVNVKQEVKYLGVIGANPIDYKQKYGDSMKPANQLPQFVRDIKHPDGLTMAADYQQSVFELDGQVEALKLVDLDKEGLSEYKPQVDRLESASENQESNYNKILTSGFIRQMFNQLDRDGSGVVTVAEAERSLLRINSRLNRNYGEDEVAQLFALVDKNNDGVLSLDEFEATIKSFF